MGTDNGNTGSSRLASVLGRLPASEVGVVEPSSVRERLSLGAGGRISAALSHERLNTEGRLPRPAVRELLSELAAGRLTEATRRRLARVGIEDVPTPELGDGVTGSMTDRGVPRPELGARLAQSDTDDQLSPGVGNRVTRPQGDGRLPNLGVDRLVSTVDGASASLPTPDIEPPTPGSLDHLQQSLTVAPEYFVGVVPEPHEQVAARLEDSPLGRSYVTSPKTLSADDLGVEREAASVWVYRSWSLSHFQLHVPLFEMPEEGATYVFYHHEYNWLRHPVDHVDAGYLNPDWGRETVVELLESAGLDIERPEELDRTRFRLADAYCTGGEPA